MGVVSINGFDRSVGELCPDGVGFVKLGDIVVRSKGTPITAAQMKTLDKKNAPVKIFAGGKTVAYFDYTDLPEKDVKTYPSVIVKSRGVIEFEYYDKPFSHKNEMWSYHSERDDISIKYLYYFLKTQEGKLRKKATSMGAFPQISIPDTENLMIPLPPFLIQRRIVEILDNFTELTAELTARKKQYKYCLDKLLDFNKDVPRRALGDFAEVVRGNGLTKKDLQKSGVGCIHYGQIYTHYGVYTSESISFVNNSLANTLKKVHYGDLIVAVTSENYDDVCKTVAWLGEDDIVTGGHTAIIRHNQNPKYLAYYFQTSGFAQQKMKIAHGTKVIEVTPSKLKEISIPLPSLEEQGRIVSILDRFNMLATDITNGLPAEIVARQKQYEYFRDRLLSFRERKDK